MRKIFFTIYALCCVVFLCRGENLLHLPLEENLSKSVKANPIITGTTVTHVTCPGGSNGSIELTVTGGTPPYTFDNGFASNMVGFFNNLSQGMYSITVTDAAACTVAEVVTVLAPDDFAAVPVIIEDVLCFDSLGTATFEVTGGTAPYRFIWSTGSGDSIATNLIPGMNYVTILDVNDCPYMDSIELSDPDTLRINGFSNINVDCAGNNTGSSMVDASGGTGSLFYLWNDNDTQITPTASNLVADTYMVLVSDSNGCQLTAQTTITEPDTLEISVVIDSVSCDGFSDGAITAMGIGGTPPYTYTWNGGFMGNQITGLIAGTYLLTVTDDNACETTGSFTVHEPDPLNIEASLINPSCFQGTDGRIELDISGGIPGYSASWDNGVVNDTIDGLAEGTHCVTVTDNNGCTETACYELSAPNEIVIDFEKMDVSCNGGDNGFIDVTVVGGTGDYQYDWSGQFFTSDMEDIQNLIIDTYTLVVTDDNGCTASISVNITEPDPISVIPFVTDVTCQGGADGAILVSLAGGTGDLDIFWSGPGGFDSQSFSIDNLVAGDYTLRIIDENNCLFMNTYVVSEPNFSPNANILSNDTICNGATDGVLVSQPFGNVGNVTYSWSSGSSGPSANNLTPGMYTVTIVDALGCRDVDTAYVIEKEAIQVVLSQIDALCYRDNSGQANIESISYGNTPADINDFIYVWSNGISGVPSIDGIEGGTTVSIIVADAGACEGAAEIIIGNPDPLTVELAGVQEISCFQNFDGALTVNANGGVGDYTYRWSAEALFQTNPTAINLGAGNYSVTVTDENDCEVFGTYSLDQPVPIINSYTVQNVACFGGSDGSIDVTSNGGAGSYTYNWSNSAASTSNPNLEAGTYYITTTDAEGCTFEDSVIVSQPEIPLTASATGEGVSCAGGSDGSVTFSAQGGAGIYSYSTDGVSFSTSPVLIGLSPGVIDVYVRDIFGCEIIVPNVVIEDADPIIVDLGPDTSAYFGQSIYLPAMIENAVGDLIYEWRLGNTSFLSCTNCPDPFVENISQPLTYELYVIDENGCVGSDIINIFFSKENVIHVPTGFTPNGDFTNDLLHVYGVNGTTILDFRIYSRWGGLVYQEQNFEVNDEALGWDGKVSLEDAEEGVYIWTAEVQYSDGTIEVENGTTTLIR